MKGGGVFRLIRVLVSIISVLLRLIVFNYRGISRITGFQLVEFWFSEVPTNLYYLYP